MYVCTPGGHFSHLSVSGFMMYWFCVGKIIRQDRNGIRQYSDGVEVTLRFRAYGNEFTVSTYFKAFVAPCFIVCSIHSLVSTCVSKIIRQNRNIIRQYSDDVEVTLKFRAYRIEITVSMSRTTTSLSG